MIWGKNDILKIIASYLREETLLKNKISRQIKSSFLINFLIFLISNNIYIFRIMIRF